LNQNGINVNMEIAIVISTLMGPIFAVQAQKFIERFEDKKRRRKDVFRQLMITRANNISDAHVAALNMIPLEFSGNNKNLRNIMDKWKVYFDHLCNNSSPETWETKRKELLADLLKNMGNYLGYKFHTTEILKEIYSPIGHEQIKTDQETILKGLSSLFNGKANLPIEIKNNIEQASITKNT
jgi:hypothetical protein